MVRLLINCPSGESRLLQVEDTATVAELKQVLSEEEGIPVRQQVLCFAGQHLKDHLSLADHALDEFTLSDEVVLYLSKQLLHPKRIYLTSRARATQKLAEVVESDMPVGEVMLLLESRGMAPSFSQGASVYLKRQDGSTIPMRVDPRQGIAALEAKIKAQEGVEPEALTFMQAQDGAMHVVVWPSAEESSDTYPVYQRSTKPQAAMPKKDAATGTPMPALVKELCVLPEGP